MQLNKEEILGENPHAIFHNKHDDVNMCHIQEAVLSGTSQSLEDVFIRKDNSIFPVFVTISPIIQDNEAIGSVVTFIDISKQKADQDTIMKEKKRFEYLAHHDTLTKLPNRLSLLEYMETKCSQNKEFTFMFLDLDGFKEINDSYGHRFGDKLLVKIALLLQNIFQLNAFIARTGGDEFVIVMECGDENLIDIHMKKLIDILNYPFEISGIDVYITASVGISMYPQDAKTTEVLMQNADAAMYNAKKMGKNTFSFYDSTFTENTLYKMTIATNLRKAILNNELTMFFQPQVNPYNKKIIGAEALIRWFGFTETISPSIFIPIAEEMGLILEIGTFVLKESFMLAKKAHDENLLDGRIAVNVSARQLSHPGFLSVLEDTIKETQCNPSLIELEITETSILENPDGTIVLLNKLKEQGFHISLDDFGTGYSSMSYLKNLPIDKLKIDQSFVRNLVAESKNHTIVKAIIALAKGLNIEVLAEGVETQEELEILQNNGINFIQGYYFHKPMTFHDFQSLFK